MTERTQVGGILPDTFLAPPHRKTADAVAAEALVASDSDLLQVLMRAVAGDVVVLNRERQIVAANDQMLQDWGVANPDTLLGKRPGEALGCVHVAEAPNGCGTGRACAECGAVMTIMSAQTEDRPASGECLLTVRINSHVEAKEYKVRCSRVVVAPHDLYVFEMTDISGTKRREALERIFFHDVLNSIGGLLGWSTLLAKGQVKDAQKAAERVAVLAKHLEREVHDQMVLLQAESGELRPTLEAHRVSAILDDLRTLTTELPAAREKPLHIEPVDQADAVVTDAALLLRVLTNMTKNALEAIQPGQAVRVGYERRAGTARFQVSNPGVLAPMVARQIFQRSFSTKAERGRGLGTYSMKLLGERYLGGRVGFFSNEAEGITFWIELPGAARHPLP